MTQDEIIEMAIKGHAGTRDAIRWAIKQALAAQQEPAPMAHIVGEIDHNGKVWAPAQPVQQEPKK
jgi:hypothetical protein